MSTNYGTTVSLTSSQIQRSPALYTRPQLNPAAQPSRLERNGSEGWLNAATFERFLSWLGPDPETAGRKYESIRSRLIKMFRARRCVFAEDLADATFERVARKLTDLTAEFTGDPARYFYGVAKKIYLEYQREVTANHWRSKSLLPTYTDNQDLEDRLEQLDEALTRISKPDRELILRYYCNSGHKINQRRALAQQFGLGANALRLRVFRIRRELRNYMSRSRPDDYSEASLTEMTIQSEGKKSLVRISSF
jgi:RNA polymerase sigma factor (sigma-70 family)